MTDRQFQWLLTRRNKLADAKEAAVLKEELQSLIGKADPQSIQWFNGTFSL